MIFAQFCLHMDLRSLVIQEKKPSHNIKNPTLGAEPKSTLCNITQTIVRLVRITRNLFYYARPLSLSHNIKSFKLFIINNLNHLACFTLIYMLHNITPESRGFVVGSPLLMLGDAFFSCMSSPLHQISVITCHPTSNDIFQLVTEQQTFNLTCH